MNGSTARQGTQTRVFVAFLTAIAVGAATAANDERVQLWQYRPDEPTKQRWLDPEIQSVQWRDGDVEVLLTMSAPCGWMPVDPDWVVQGQTVRLRFSWSGLIDGSPAVALCKKYVRAWVFRVPNRKYQVTISKVVPRFAQQDGKVVLLNEPK